MQKLQVVEFSPYAYILHYFGKPVYYVERRAGVFSLFEAGNSKLIGFSTDFKDLLYRNSIEEVKFNDAR